MNPLKKSPQELIIQGNTGLALKELLKVTKEIGKKDLYKDVMLLSARHEDYKKALLSYTISYDDATRTISQINQALMEICDKISENDDSGEIEGDFNKFLEAILWTSVGFALIYFYIAHSRIFGILYFSFLFMIYGYVQYYLYRRDILAIKYVRNNKKRVQIEENFLKIVSILMVFSLGIFGLVNTSFNQGGFIWNIFNIIFLIFSLVLVLISSFGILNFFLKLLSSKKKTIK